MSRPEHIAPPEEVGHCVGLIAACVVFRMCVRLGHALLPGREPCTSHLSIPSPRRALAQTCLCCVLLGGCAQMCGRDLLLTPVLWCGWQFYNREEASKYATNSRMREIQTSLTERALELLALPSEDCFVLDVGCGSGLSGECLTEHGHHWIGCDISRDMLEIAKEQDVEGDVVLNDMGQVRLSLTRAHTHTQVNFRTSSTFVNSPFPAFLGSALKTTHAGSALQAGVFRRVYQHFSYPVAVQRRPLGCKPLSPPPYIFHVLV
jgi:hypothetical protein